MAGCSNGELLKKFLEIKEDNLTEARIRQVAEQFEVMASTAEGLNSRVDDRAKQVKTGNKDMDKVTCYNCRKKVIFPRSAGFPRKT